MTSPPLSRRAFLGAGLSVVGGLATATLVPGLAGAAFAAQDETKYFPLVLSPWLYADADPQRAVIALSHSTSKGIQYASGPSVKIRFRSPDGSWTPLVDTTYDRVGLPKGRGVYVTDATFDQAGVWKAEARAGGQKIPFSLQVNETPAGPVPGDQAPTAASPTTTDTLGVDPICTRDPQCPLHTESLSTVIGQGKPVVVLFATPARCQSQYCAPVLDEFLKVSEPLRDKAHFVHVEIYKSATGTALVPTVDAWALPGEPAMFTVDTAGTVRGRLEGAFGGTEMQQEIDKLLAASSGG
ncbi:MAG: hypothetical protein U0W40_01545 [Acidimicrobiia bacterium]